MKKITSLQEPVIRLPFWLATQKFGIFLTLCWVKQLNTVPWCKGCIKLPSFVNIQHPLKVLEYKSTSDGTKKKKCLKGLTCRKWPVWLPPRWWPVLRRRKMANLNRLLWSTSARKRASTVELPSASLVAKHLTSDHLSSATRSGQYGGSLYVIYITTWFIL